MRRPRTLRPLALLALLATFAFLIGCASARRAAQRPVTLDDGQERILGARLSAAYEDSVRLHVDKRIQDYVNQIGEKLARLSDRPSIPYTFRILKEDRPRGLVLPGGYIYISAGLLRQLRSQCEVAAVLAHMMAHSALGHPVEAVERADGVGPDGVRAIIDTADRGAAVRRAAVALRGMKSYERAWESDADRLTMLYLARIGLSSEGYPLSIEAFLPPAVRLPVPYWEGEEGRDIPLDKRLSQVRAEYGSMGLDAGLPCEQPQARWEPMRARLGSAP